MATTRTAQPTQAPLSLEGRLAALPTAPGCYLMKDGQGKVIYVGKAKVLRDRVRSYFGSPKSLTPKTRELVSRIEDFEVVRTDTEREALLLESALIKRHLPKYNILLKDDKTYPFLKITNDEWPTVIYTRNVRDDTKRGARYFGPFADSGAASQTLKILQRAFTYRKPNAPCRDKKLTGDWPRACMYFHIGQCLGPCIGATTKDDYGAVLDNVAKFLSGKSEDLINARRRKMEEAAENLDFETAARLRDEVQDLERVTERQKMVVPGATDADILGLARGAGGDACVQVNELRGGKLLGAGHYLLESHIDDADADIVQSFVTQHYATVPQETIPPQLYLPHALPDEEATVEMLRARRGGAIKILVPQRGDKHKLVELAAKSAVENLEQERLKWLNDEQKTTMALTELATALDLPGLPRRIECYDISHSQGTNQVAAMVVFEGGKPKKSDYRKFAIKTVEGNNDFASLQEVLRRRFTRAQESLAAAQAAQGVADALVPFDPLDTATAGAVEAAAEDGAAAPDEKALSWARLPDLIIIDGGKGQLSSSLETLREMNVNLPTVGLAKENEEIFLPENTVPVILPRDSQALFLVQRVRDETHRFAITFHRQKRGKSALKSSLDDLPGIGPARKKALLKHFGSPKRIREATVEELMEVDGISRGLAEKLRDAL
ncbi:MAG TPA: excinuclease ABC subunit UvrC [Thermomicrobiales bacterium]